MDHRLKQRISLLIAAVFPIFSGMLWGGFWLNGISGMENFSSGFAALALAFAAGTLFSRLRGIGVGKLAVWGIAFYLYLNFNLLFPAAFYFGMTGIDRKRDRYGVFFASGFISGGLLGSFFGFPMLMLILLSAAQFPVNTGVLHRRLPENKFWRRVAKVINAAAFIGVICASTLSFDRDIRNLKNSSGASDITLLCALGMSNKADATMLMVSRSPVQKRSPWLELVSSRVNRISPVKRITGMYDVIFVEDIPADAFNTPRHYLASLAKDGILVLPVEMCRKIPELQWLTIPSSLETTAVYAAAKKQGKISLSGDMIEQNILQILENEGTDDLLLRGALSGSLAAFEPQIPETVSVLPRGDFRYFLLGVVVVLILAELLCHKLAFRDNICVAQCAFAFALISGVLLSENHISGSVEYGWLLSLLAGTVIFVQFSARERALRGMIFIALAAAWIWYFFPGIASAIPALLSAGMVLAFRQRFFWREHPRTGVDWQTILTVLALSCGVFLGSSMPDAVKEILAAANVIYLWSLIRS